MSDNKQLQNALEIATMAHKNVIRRNGDPYIFHVLRVMKLNNFPKLAYFYQVYTRLTDDMLVELDNSPEFEVGDEVVIHPIPREERLCYGSGW